LPPEANGFWKKRLLLAKALKLSFKEPEYSHSVAAEKVTLDVGTPFSVDVPSKGTIEAVQVLLCSGFEAGSG
jgi:hypothetical protein